MNSLKTVVVVTVLLGVMYAVYSAINGGNGTSPQNAGEWPAAPSSGKTGYAATNSGPNLGSPPLNVQVNIPGESSPPATSQTAGKAAPFSGSAPGNPSFSGNPAPANNSALSGNSAPSGNSASLFAGSKSDWSHEAPANPFKTSNAPAASRHDGCSAEGKRLRRQVQLDLGDGARRSLTRAIWIGCCASSARGTAARNSPKRNRGSLRTCWTSWPVRSFTPGSTCWIRLIS